MDVQGLLPRRATRPPAAGTLEASDPLKATLPRAPTSPLRIMCVSIAWALWSAPAEAAPTPFVKGPYLQELGPTGVTVRVEIESKATASLEITHEGAAPIVVSDPAEATFHSLRTDKLKP